MSRGTPLRGIRVSDAEWERLAEVAESLGTTRAELVRSWIRWAIGAPGGEPPRRPEQRP